MEKLPDLKAIDWMVIAIFFSVTLAIGLYFSRRAKSSLMDYFVAGRKMTWWVAGTSIVATSFAADTPLVISGWMRTIGLERNWFWWGTIMGMMLCTFFFARMWRRANILTDVEFNELRYGGKPAAGLRIFHASYRSLIQNTLIMGWVTLAMTKILDVTLDIPTLVFLEGQILPILVPKGVEVFSVVAPDTIADWFFIGSAIIPAKATGIILCLGVAAIYSAISGLWGVVATDLFQFCLAMLGTILLMVIVFMLAGSPTQLVQKAHQAVQDNQVRNRPALQRSIFNPALIQSDPAVLNRLIEAGLLRQNDAGNDVLHWTAQGMSRSDLENRLNALDIRDADALLDQWERSYTVGKTSLTDRRTVQQLMDAGMLADDSRTERLKYYRLTNVSWSEEQFLEMIKKAGVEETSIVMAAWRGDVVVAPRKITSFLPPFDLKGGGLLAVWSLVVFLGMQWWYGAQGDGFLAQRLFSCKNEKHSVFAMLWFNLAHFVLRPWPWIVVGVGSLFLIPDITRYGAHYDQEYAYVVMLMKYLPDGLRGLMVAALMAAYMSTISTHVNFGASYVINDLYTRFIHPSSSERLTLLVSQVISVILAIFAGIYALYSESIAEGWFLIIELMSGVGVVVLLRWYWWRISAWSELAAMAASLGMYALLNWTTLFQSLFASVGLPSYWLDEYAVRFTLNLTCSTIFWVSITFIMPAEKEEQLIRFYRQVRPAGWWNRIAEKAGFPDHLIIGWLEWLSWLLGVTGLFAMIFCLGKLCFGQYLQSLLFGIYALFATFLVFRLISKMDWSSIYSE